MEQMVWTNFDFCCCWFALNVSLESTTGLMKARVIASNDLLCFFPAVCLTRNTNDHSVYALLRKLRKRYIEIITKHE